MKLSVALRACSAGGLMPLSVARVAGMPSHRLASPLVRQCPFIPVGTGLYDANDVELLRVTGRCWLPADDGGHALQCLMTRALVDPDFDKLKRKRGFLPLHFVCTTEYDATMPNVSVAFPHEKLKNIFGEYLSKLGLTQLRIAETEKYAHVTFFFNGGQEEVFPGEDRCLIPSPKVATYDLKPEMSAPAITEEAIRRIESGKYDVIILNFANCDMVGHTGVFEAAVEAVETVDTCVARVVNATTDLGGVALITADHGNADQMLDENGQPFTAHTTNPVPFCIVGAAVRLRDGRLADIAPTMLDLMGLNQPEEMDGKTLIIN